MTTTKTNEESKESKESKERKESDFEVIKEILEKRGIQYEGNGDNGGWIEIEAGYAGFTSNFNFDENGNLVSVEAYEG